jgi:PPOX class probable F420-dependent enzyme
MIYPFRRWNRPIRKDQFPTWIIEEAADMPGPIPDQALELFQKPALAHLATLMPDGLPQVTPIWIDFDGTYLLVNTLRGRQKELNVRKRPGVSLDIVDPTNPWHWLSVRGYVVEITEEGANEHIDKMAKKYTGQDKYGFHRPGDVRVICKIRPDRVNYQSSPREVGTFRS